MDVTTNPDNPTNPTDPSVVTTDDDDDDDEYNDSLWYIPAIVLWIFTALIAILGFAVKKEIAIWAMFEFLQLVGYLPLIGSDLNPDTARFAGSFNWFNE